jgi:hypothetical protein
MVTLAGFALRLYYLTTTHPFFDEYITVLAARETWRQGWPVLPSGLFYEHGLLATYLTAPFAALFVDAPLEAWQTGHWRLMLARWPSALGGTLTIPLIFAVGRRCFKHPSPPNPLSHWERGRKRNSPLPMGEGPGVRGAWVGLLAAGLFALSTEGMVWGGRARMYALATLLVLLTVYLAYRGAIYPAPARYRWLALLTLLATLLTQLGALTLVVPLMVGMVAVTSLFTKEGRVWFLRPAILGEGVGLAVVISLALLVKRLGRPLGAAALGEVTGSDLPGQLAGVVSYQTTFHFTWPDTIAFLAREFGPSHHYGLAIATLVGVVVGLLMWLIRRRPLSLFNLFLWVVFGLIILQMVTLLEPFRRNPRYIVMYLPLFYLIAAAAIWSLFPSILHTPTPYSNSTLLPLTLFAALSYNDLRVALVTPEPAYEEALAFVAAEWQEGDKLLLMNTAAAGLYLGHADGFAVQNDAEQFLLDSNTAPSLEVDRWLGVPWVGTATAFNEMLNENPRVWFVMDTIRQPVYFQGGWLAILNSQMEQVWAKEDALVYRTAPGRIPLPTRPDVPVGGLLGRAIELTGYTLAPPNPHLRLVLFWRALAPIPADYTIFIHLRDKADATVAQYDGQPLDGAYPTGRWQPGEAVITPVTLFLPPDLPAGRYVLWGGMYHLETLERLPVANDSSGENAIYLGEVTFGQDLHQSLPVPTPTQTP